MKKRLVKALWALAALSFAAFSLWLTFIQRAREWAFEGQHPVVFGVSYLALIYFGFKEWKKRTGGWARLTYPSE